MQQKGSGLLQPKRQSYKLTKDCRYDDLTIDIVQLFGFNRLIVMKDSEVVINQMVDDDFIELITKRYTRYTSKNPLNQSKYKLLSLTVN